MRVKMGEWTVVAERPWHNCDAASLGWVWHANKKDTHKAAENYEIVLMTRIIEGQRHELVAQPMGPVFRKYSKWVREWRKLPAPKVRIYGRS